jgi:hypothetical protein
MPIMFNSILSTAGFSLTEVRLMRHKDNQALKGRTPYELWRDDRPQFEVYQSTHSMEKRAKLNTPYWAVFLGTPQDETLFIGMYRVLSRRLLDRELPNPSTNETKLPGSCDLYELILDQKLCDLAGRLVIDWGAGDRAWIQRADRQDKPVLELRAQFKEPEFPGYLNFREPLSRLDLFPPGWKDALQSSKGIYLLTCPRTHEQYIGSATGENGFWGRWQEYAQTGHGGDVALKSREPSDYQATILEVAGSAATVNEILQMEILWKLKLQSREMGLNRN